MDGQVTWSDLGFSCGKTLSEPLAATKEKTSQPSLKKSSKSSNRKPPVLKCLKKAGLVGGGTTMRWKDDGAWCGALTTRNTGECPNAVVVSRLSQILEETPHPKYNLTAKACQGILRRAERRGKDLPKLLKEVLIRQSQGASPQEQTEAHAPTEAPTSYAVRIRGGCDGGGKGALVQTEKSGTLGTGNDQTIFCMATQQGGAELRTDARAPTLTAAAGMSGNNQPVVAIPINDKATRWQGGGESRNHDGSGNGLGIGKEGDPSPTLTAGDRHGVMCMTPWDAQSQRVYDGDGVSPTLSSRENSGLNRETVLCAGFKAGQGAQAGGIGDCEEVAPTLAAAPSGTNQTPAVVALDMTYACDVIRECGEQVPALQARMGTGGNQVPLTYQMNGFGDYRDANVASICKQRDFKDSTDLAITHMVVRRLTPMECERLQGFPDHWTDIGDWTDEKGKKHKDADSPKYKALGNSIALPFWDWMLRRMARYLPEDATLGSLFDGISGFNVCWARIHGAECCRWSSEIEQFPIAVAKKHFGDEETGKEGDFEKFFGRNKKRNV